MRCSAPRDAVPRRRARALLSFAHAPTRRAARGALGALLSALVLAALGGPACVDLVDPFTPHDLALIAPSAVHALSPGESAPVVVQVRDTDGEGVNRADVLFTVVDPEILELVPSADTSAAQVVATSADGVALGVESAGLAEVTVRVRAGVAADVEAAVVVTLLGADSASATAAESAEAGVEGPRVDTTGRVVVARFRTLAPTTTEEESR